MTLLLLARLKATLHWWHRFNGLRGHRICRIYRWLGLDTMAVFCDCGRVFGQKHNLAFHEFVHVAKLRETMRAAQKGQP